MRAWGLLLVSGVALAAPLTKQEAVRALKSSMKDVKSVSQVFADLGDGRFPVLFVTRGRDCVERMVDQEKEQNCSATTVPHAAVLKRDGSALVVEAELALPTAAAPWDQPEELKWGVTHVKDDDGDGKPELMVIYGYHGPTMWGVGDTYYRDLCLLNLDKLAAAMHVVLDEKPQATTSPDLETKFKIVPGEVQLTRRAGDFAGGSGERAYQETKISWRWDAASDQYREVKPAKK
jgi:hypothetical protein